MADAHKCKHALCTCTVAAGEKFCSAVCEGASKRTNLACDCPHPDCKGHVAKL
ncbi:MAG: hypothetical protein ACR2JE_16655 [Acidobacteriaceae bacterium]